MKPTTEIEFKYAYDTFSKIDLRSELGTSTEFDLDHETTRQLDSIQKIAAEHGVKASTKLKGDYDHKRISIDAGISSTTVTTVSMVCASLAVAVPFLKTIQAGIIQWLKTKSSRSVRIKHGSIEVEVKGTHDIDKVINAINELSKKAPSKSAKK